MSIPTPREITGERTTWEQEVQFYSDLVAASPRVAVESVGTSQVHAREMWLVRIGAPSAPPAPTAGTANSILVTASQHGNEYMAREAALELVRDLAFTTDPDLVAYLTTHPVYVMPTCSPDRIENPGRPNLAGINLNRDHFALTQGEVRAIWEAIYRVTPTMLYDMHEYAGAYTFDLAPVPPSHPQISDQIRDLGQQLNAHLGAVVTGEGWTHGPYTHASTTEPSMLVNAAALTAGALSFTPETCTFEPEADRAEVHRIASRAAIEFHRTRAAEVLQYVTQGRAAKVKEGQLARAFYRLLDSDAVLPVLPSAYRITDAQHEALTLHRRVFRLATTPDDGGWLVPMGQDAQPAIPLMFDPHSPYAIADAVPVYDRSPRTISAWGQAQIGGMTCNVTSAQIQVGGELRPMLPL